MRTTNQIQSILDTIRNDHEQLSHRQDTMPSFLQDCSPQVTPKTHAQDLHPDTKPEVLDQDQRPASTNVDKLLQLQIDNDRQVEGRQSVQNETKTQEDEPLQKEKQHQLQQTQQRQYEMANENQQSVQLTEPQKDKQDSDSQQSPWIDELATEVAQKSNRRQSELLAENNEENLAQPPEQPMAQLIPVKTYMVSQRVQTSQQDQKIEQHRREHASTEGDFTGQKIAVKGQEKQAEIIAKYLQQEESEESQALEQAKNLESIIHSLKNVLDSIKDFKSKISSEKSQGILENDQIRAEVTNFLQFFPQNLDCQMQEGLQGMLYEMFDDHAKKAQAKRKRNRRLKREISDFYNQQTRFLEYRLKSLKTDEVKAEPPEIKLEEPIDLMLQGQAQMHYQMQGLPHHKLSSITQENQLLFRNLQSLWHQTQEQFNKINITSQPLIEVDKDLVQRHALSIDNVQAPAISATGIEANMVTDTEVDRAIFQQNQQRAQTRSICVKNVKQKKIKKRKQKNQSNNAHQKASEELNAFVQSIKETKFKDLKDFGERFLDKINKIAVKHNLATGKKTFQKRKCVGPKSNKFRVVCAMNKCTYRIIFSYGGTETEPNCIKVQSNDPSPIKFRSHTHS